MPSGTPRTLTHTIFALQRQPFEDTNFFRTRSGRDVDRQVVVSQAGPNGAIAADQPRGRGKAGQHQPCGCIADGIGRHGTGGEKAAARQTM